ncbi:hypothetical protein XENTR_v10004109 [Xenopus tropicalis]|nr:hypothetical protein XENTR_v10004109 [Xenopus tropicalis]
MRNTQTCNGGFICIELSFTLPGLDFESLSYRPSDPNYRHFFFHTMQSNDILLLSAKMFKGSVIWLPISQKRWILKVQLNLKNVIKVETQMNKHKSILTRKLVYHSGNLQLF